MDLTSNQFQPYQYQWSYIEFFLLQPTITYILCMILCINAFIAVDYLRFRAQCRNKDARNEFTRSTTLHNHAMFIEFREQTNKAINELTETFVKIMHSQNVITNGLKEVESNICYLSDKQNEMTTTQNDFVMAQKSLSIANGETMRLQIDMFAIQNTFSNGLKELERNVREMVHVQMDFTTVQNQMDTDIKDIKHIVRAHRERLDKKDIADKSLYDELCDLQEEMDDLHQQQHAKITENAVSIAEIALRCKGLVEQEKRNIQRTLDMYRYWKTSNELYQGRVSANVIIDGMLKQYYNFTFDKNKDYIKSITDATIPASVLSPNTNAHLGF